MSKSTAKHQPFRAGPGVRDVAGNSVDANAEAIGMLTFNGQSAVENLSPAIRKHLDLPPSGDVTLTADQFDHLIFDACASGWYNAVKQVNRWLGEVSGGALKIGEKDGPTDDGIGEPQGHA